mgnify:CR=1 FL=1
MSLSPLPEASGGYLGAAVLSFFLLAVPIHGVTLSHPVNN